MKMRVILATLAITAILVVSAAPLFAAVLWSEGFETYKTDAGQIWGGLDKNKTGSPNARPTAAATPGSAPTRITAG